MRSFWAIAFRAYTHFLVEKRRRVVQKYYPLSIANEKCRRSRKACTGS